MTVARGRVRLAAAVALVAALAVAAVVLLTGGASAGSGDLAWKGKVQVFSTAIPTDEVLYAKIQNTSLRDVDLDVTRARVLDADGEPVRSSTRYLAAFAHGIFSWSQGPLSDFEKRRLGQIATLKPGQGAPITVAWRVPKGAPRPVTVDLGPSELRIPAKR
jgi:hypothetical protein